MNKNEFEQEYLERFNSKYPKEVQEKVNFLKTYNEDNNLKSFHCTSDTKEELLLMMKIFV